MQKTAGHRDPGTTKLYDRRGYNLELGGLAEVTTIRTHHVSIYVEILTRNYSAPTVNQYLAATRKTRCFDGREARKFIDSIDVSTIAAL